MERNQEIKYNYNTLIVTDYSAPYEGNFIESIKALHQKNLEKGNNVVYLFPERAKKIEWIKKLEKEQNFKIYYFKNDTLFNVIKNIKKIIKEENIKVIYTHFCRHKTQFAIKLVRLTCRKIKVVSHFHNHCKVNGNPLKKIFMKLAYKLYEGDLNIGCSESVSMSMPYKKNKVTYVENGISFKRLDNVDNMSMKFPDNKFIVLMFGFDYYRKGVDLAIKAIKELKNSNIVLAISLASNTEKVKEIIIKEYENVPNFITFLEPTNNIASYYTKADLFLSAAREEGFCYSIVEAAYCKTKILSSNIPGVPQNIPGEYIFESNNYIDLKNKINEIYNDNSNKYDEAREYVMKKYNLENWTNEIIKKIDEIVINN